MSLFSVCVERIHSRNLMGDRLVKVSICRTDPYLGAEDCIGVGGGGWHAGAVGGGRVVRPFRCAEGGDARRGGGQRDASRAGLQARCLFRPTPARGYVPRMARGTQHWAGGGGDVGQGGNKKRKPTGGARRALCGDHAPRGGGRGRGYAPAPTHPHSAWGRRNRDRQPRRRRHSGGAWCWPHLPPAYPSSTRAHPYPSWGGPQTPGSSCPPP